MMTARLHMNTLMLDSVQCIEPGAAEMLGGVPARWRTAFQAISCSGTESVSRAMKTDTTAEGPAFRRHPLARGRLYVQYRGDALQAHGYVSKSWCSPWKS